MGISSPECSGSGGDRVACKKISSLPCQRLCAIDCSVMFLPATRAAQCGECAFSSAVIGQSSVSLAETKTLLISNTLVAFRASSGRFMGSIRLVDLRGLLPSRRDRARGSAIMFRTTRILPSAVAISAA